MQVLEEGSLKILVLPGDIHGELVDEMGASLDAIQNSGSDTIAINMSNVNYIYSRGIGILVRTQKTLKEKEGSLYLFNLRTSMQKILMETNLLDFLNGFSTREEMDFEIIRGKDGDSETTLELGLKTEFVSQSASHAILRLSGTADSEADIQLLLQKCRSVIKPNLKSLILDLEDLIYVDDMAVTNLATLSDELVLHQAELVLKKANEIIVDQIDILGLIGKFKIEI